MDNKEYPLRAKKINVKPQEYRETICKCGNPKSKGSLCCVECAHKQQRITERPEPIILAQEIIEMGFVGTGKKYGVSDNAIRKWCVAYNMPKKKEELKEWLTNNS